MNIKQNIPMIVLPCSAAKKPFSCRASEMYIGKGYLPILNGAKSLIDGKDYHLFFVSALHGLIAGNCVIEPYDMRMSASRKDYLLNATMLRTMKILSLYQPSRIIACLPKEYLSFVISQLSANKINTPISHPSQGAGIGTQRGFLKAELQALTSQKAKNKAMTVWVFEFSDNPRIRPNAELQVVVNVGDMVTPWLSGVGEDKVIGPPAKVIDIVSEGGGCKAITEDGNQYTATDIGFGLSSEEKAIGFAIVGQNTLHKTQDEKTILLSRIKTNINIDIAS